RVRLSGIAEKLRLSHLYIFQRNQNNNSKDYRQPRGPQHTNELLSKNSCPICKISTGPMAVWNLCINDVLHYSVYILPSFAILWLIARPSVRLQGRPSP